MDDFDRQYTKTLTVMVIAIIAKLVIAGSLIWLAVYAIDALTA